LDQRLELPIDGAALVVLGVASKAVWDLYLPAVLDKHPAVGPCLTAGLGHERQAKLEMQSEILKGPLAGDSVV
jgi:hypothetical protein